ncbi:hypothetical protein POTOM_005539 [Populus tomentosa]|uniref:ABC transporter domain-containing protein n=1 Tax=Populus tomentosa TaxID=118781 RepID=A0A8X8D6N2_POPTO|nr:hypothetical protein POTOM_005539 [Populus tomentosa]
MWLFEIRQEAVQFGLVGHGITLNPWMMNVVKTVEQAGEELGRLSGDVLMTGNVLLNGRKRRLDYGGGTCLSSNCNITTGLCTSGGEKQRLSIALETLIRPQLLFLDEPTSGLDSAAASFVIQTLRNIAHDGRTVISSVHQPSSEVFTLFDDLFLLSAGEAVYFGEAKMAVEFFAEAVFPCPSRRNPSDHFLNCINSDSQGMRMYAVAV